MFKIIEIKPKIFLIQFKKQFHLNMMFLRYQEYYESSSPKFRGKSFEIFDFMEWYSKTFGDNAFTYTVDWSGFNFPGNIVADIWNKGITDLNRYDIEMKKIYDKCFKIYPDGNFYIIGTVGKRALKHEIAHGFFYCNEKYRQEMIKLVKELNPEFRKKIYTWFKKIGYTPKVYVDECQAFLATGIDSIEINNEDKPFIKCFNGYYKL